MIDLHSHSLFSDGALVPAEHLRRFEVLGYSAVAITDHADSSNLDFVVPRIVQAARTLNPHFSTLLVPGIELTHVPPALFAELVRQARQQGAMLVVAHGETPVEPVASGSNRAAIEAGVDILAHPGFLTEEEAALAAKMGIYLELSGRKGHSLTNGHVARMAEASGALLAVNSDAHAPGDFLTAQAAAMIARGAGLSAARAARILPDMAALVERLRVRLAEC